MQVLYLGLTVVSVFAFLMISLIVMSSKSSASAKAVAMMLNGFFWMAFWAIGAASLNEFAKAAASGL